MTRGLGQSPAPEGPYRAMARLYDQQLRLFAAHYSNMWDGRSNSAAVVSAYFHELVDLSRPALFVEAGAYRAVIDRTYPLESVVDATRYVETGQKTGNVVLTVAAP